MDRSESLQELQLMDIPDLPLEFEKRDSRVYIHRKCKTITEISDIHFIDICDVFNRRLTATRCAKCGICSLKAVKWEDTGEAISDYRARVRRALSEKVGKNPLVLGGIVALAACVIVGPLTLYQYFQDAGREPLFFSLFFLGAILFSFILGCFLELALRIKRSNELLEKHGFYMHHIK
jgi:hypothetical protein